MQTQTITKKEDDINFQYETYWDDEEINKLDPLYHQGQVIARIDKNNKLVYKEHFAVVYNNHRLPTKVDSSINKRHNVQVFIKNNKQSIESPSIYKPSVGFSANGPLGTPCYPLADEDYHMIIKITFFHPKGEIVKIFKVPVKKFKDSPYSNKFFGDYNGRVDDKTDKDLMKSMRHDYQKYVPLNEMKVIETIYDINFDIYLGDII